jgi:hypothetical protein
VVFAEGAKAALGLNRHKGNCCWHRIWAMLKRAARWRNWMALKP